MTSSAFTAPRISTIPAGADWRLYLLFMPTAEGAFLLRASTAAAACFPGLALDGTDPKIPLTSTITTSIAVSMTTATVTGCVLLNGTICRCRTMDSPDLRTRRLLSPLVVVTINAVSGSVWLGNDGT